MNKSVSTHVENELSNQLKKHFESTSELIAGVSGGADSMALLYALKKLNHQAFVVHVNYGLRGEESDKDQELVKQLSFEWGFECISVKPEKESENGNFQQWAREQRYQIFSDLKREFDADAIAVAHHQDDQVETILQKVFRGSAPENWQGMSEFENDIFRPLLNIPKKDILRYCEENAIPFREDKSNTSNKYARNLIRNELSVQMDELLPGWKANVLKLKEFGSLNEQAISALVKRVQSESGLSVDQLKKFDNELAKAIIRKFVEQENDVSLSTGELQSIFHLLDSQVGSVFEIDKTTSLIKEREHLVFSGVHHTKSFKIEEDDLSDELSFQSMSFLKGDEKQSEFYLDIDSLQFPLNVRTWEAGDRFQPLGMEGSQLVSDHLTNRKISVINKEKSLVLVGSDGTIYALFFGGDDDRIGTVSELAKATEDTTRYLSVIKKKEL